MQTTPDVAGFVAKSGEATSFQDDADGIVASVDHRGHVVGIEIDAFVIVGEGWLEDLLGGDLRAVDVGAVLAHAADVELGFLDLAFGLEGPSEITCGDAGLSDDPVIIEVATNPMRLPVARFQ